MVTMDDDLDDLGVADILIEDGVIAEIRLSLGDLDAEVVDAAGSTILPGFVDTHLHTWQHGLRGICVDWSNKDYMRAIRINLAPEYRPADMYAGNYVGALDGLNAGVTTVVDFCHNILTPDHAYAAVQGLKDAGVRAVYAHGLHAITDHGFGERQVKVESGFSSQDDRLDFARRLAAEQFGSADQLVTMGIAPAEIEITPFDEVRSAFELARELNARLTMHVGMILIPELFDDVKQLAEASLLDEDLVLVHCSFSTDEELGLIAAHGSHVSVCPETEMLQGMGVPAFDRLIAHGIEPTLGVDIVSNNSVDMFAPMRVGLNCARMVHDEAQYATGHQPDTAAFSTRDALRWATVNGARAAGLQDRVGTLTPGKDADVVVIAASDFNMAGWYEGNPGGMVVFHAHPGNVETVLVRGRFVKRDGRLTHVDPGAGLSTLGESHDHLMQVAEKNGGLIPQPPVELPLFGPGDRS